MRLYLSSYHIGNAPDDLVGMVGGNKRVAVVINAHDYWPVEGRNDQLRKQSAQLSALGFQPEELDLREFFNKPLELETKMSQFGLVWLKGGNSFVLKRAIEQSGFDVVIKKMLATDDLVYGGFSAGVIVATPTMRGIELADYPEQVPNGYQAKFSWDGMALVPYSFVPHYRSNHPESAAMEKVVEYFKEHQMPYRALRDGEVLIVEAGVERLSGRPNS
ncbi:MAG: Type 1 glutamine amidotransferase-like domain-containing protein [Candidatus Cybelea sp.]